MPAWPLPELSITEYRRLAGIDCVMAFQVPCTRFTSYCQHSLSEPQNVVDAGTKRPKVSNLRSSKAACPNS